MALPPIGKPTKSYDSVFQSRSQFPSITARMIRIAYRILGIPVEPNKSNFTQTEIEKVHGVMIPYGDIVRFIDQNRGDNSLEEEVLVFAISNAFAFARPKIRDMPQRPETIKFLGDLFKGLCGDRKYMNALKLIELSSHFDEAQKTDLLNYMSARLLTHHDSLIELSNIPPTPHITYVLERCKVSWKCVNENPCPI